MHFLPEDAPGIPSATLSPEAVVITAPSFLSAVSRVAIRPNAMALQRMLNIPHSLLMVLLMAATAPLEGGGIERFNNEKKKTEDKLCPQSS